MRILRTLSLVATLAVLLVGAQSTKAPRPLSAAMNSPSSVSDGASSVAGAAADDAPKSAINDARDAKRVLEGLAESYRYLDDVTVSLGTTPKGEQAVAYYTEGRIVIDRAHTVDVTTILAHEIWHVIDWRDNGRLDWAEDLPPSNSDIYLNR